MKKHFAKFLALVLVLAMVTACFAACRQGGGQEGNRTESQTQEQSKKDDPQESKQEPADDSKENPTEESKDEPEESKEEGGEDSKTEPIYDPDIDMPEVILPPGITYNVNHKYFYGVGYVEDQMNNRVTVDQAVYLIKCLGCRSVRIWADCVINSHKLEQWKVDRLHDLIGQLQAAGIQCIFLYYRFESPQMPYMSTCLPKRGTSNYKTAMNNWGDLVSMLAKEFKEVKYWELGNEWNHTGALNPIGWTEDGTGTEPFTLKEKADISTDLIQITMKKLRAAGNKGTVLLPAMAPSDGMDGIAMTQYLEYIYENIESGDWGTTNKRDFFDALAWHPYEIADPGLEWVSNNNRIYNIAIEHGDGGIPVYLTEYGFPDGGNARADAQQAEWMVHAYKLIQQYMPYVESMHYYRMFTDTSRGADLYGLINQPEDGFGPKNKGLRYQEMTGGTGNLWQFYLPLDEDDE